MAFLGGLFHKFAETSSEIDRPRSLIGQEVLERVCRCWDPFCFGDCSHPPVEYRVLSDRLYEMALEGDSPVAMAGHIMCFERKIGIPEMPARARDLAARVHRLVSEAS